MNDSLWHRGPDDEGFLVRDRVGLGMRRLSIIDVAGGRQPIHNEDKSVWAVFNGEIYNYDELRDDLERRGHHFYTKSDTETLVHLYEEYGDAGVTRLRGMFAYALWDERRQPAFRGPRPARPSSRSTTGASRAGSTSPPSCARSAACPASRGS